MDTFVAAISLGAAAVASASGWVFAWRARRAAEARAAEVAASQRLLRKMMDAAPAAVLLLTDDGRVELSNPAARTMFAEGGDLDGQNFLTLLGSAPAAFRDALLGSEDALFTVGASEGDAETFRLAKRVVTQDGKPHTLVTVEPLTREIRRQEVDIWKKLLRTISHELNNSLAPISSLVHSARLIADKPEQLPKLARVFDTIEDRTNHLQEFLEGYVRFARLPRPRKASVVWSELVGRVRELWPFSLVGDVPRDPGTFDAGQIEQVLINLLKNAHESGSARDAITLEVVALERGAFEIRVGDRGSGMSEQVLADALLPFYSTKERGTGLGLALCREIIEAHDGKIRLQNRDGGGLLVTFSLPGPEPMLSSITRRLTLTHR